MKFDSLKKTWYVAYTRPQVERKAKAKLDEMYVKTFLPMQTTMRQWSDRRKKIEVPLFPNYIFIHTNSFEKFNLLNIPELVRYVAFEGQPAIVPDSVIESMEKLLTGDVEVSNENLQTGVKVKITQGKFAGVEGTLLRRNVKTRIVVSIEALRQSISVDIPAAYAEAIY
jgi:transcription antitermination factor NusG